MGLAHSSAIAGRVGVAISGDNGDNKVAMAATGWMRLRWRVQVDMAVFWCKVDESGICALNIFTVVGNVFTVVGNVFTVVGNIFTVVGNCCGHLPNWVWRKTPPYLPPKPHFPSYHFFDPPHHSE